MAEVAAKKSDIGKETGRLLRNLATAAAGESHVEKNRFRAVNDALLPILADGIASMHSREIDNKLWQDALGALNAGHKLKLEEVASLNRLLHIALPGPNDDKGERGAVIDLPEEFLGEKFEAFEATFDLTYKDAMEKQFRCCWTGEGNDPARWVLVQTQAACDYAQKQPGPLPFHLGLYLPKSRSTANNTPPAALWCSPCFEYDKKFYYLHVNARFPMSLSKEKLKQTELLFRLREQILNNLIYQIHIYGARPGYISFRK